MRKIINGLAAGAAMALLAGCNIGSKEKIDENSPMIERSAEVGDFTSVEISGPFQVVIGDGAPGPIALKGPQAVLDKTEMEIENGRLKIKLAKGFKADWSWKGDSGVTINFNHNALNTASIAGSGMVDIARIADRDFSGNVAGSGDIVIREMAANEAEFNIAGSGDITASGTAKTLNISIAGSGDFQNPGLSATNAAISIAGSGDVVTDVSGTADISIVGSGDVRVTGGAECKISKMGSGDVVCL